MPSSRSGKKPHPYLHGNFAPIEEVRPPTPCAYTGAIPLELAGGQYVRNGGNPVTNEDLGRDAHWFDGDGMLSGVSFPLIDNAIRPEFVNQYILTDAYLSAITTPSLHLPIIPSITTLVNPASSLCTIIIRIFRTISLVIISHLPGSRQAIKKISVANTGILYHDGRVLATCESGPPMRVSLPGLETIGWYDGRRAEGETKAALMNGLVSESIGKNQMTLTEREEEEEEEVGKGFGGDGLFSFTTAHPRVDLLTNELILFHSTFISPFVHYSIISSSYHRKTNNNLSLATKRRRLVNIPIPGITAAKMMHDFGVSHSHTVILDLPLSLDPRNLLRNQPVVSYNPSGKSRFGVFPRWNPEQVRWFETSACCIFHTANTWDEISPVSGSVEAVNMLACRLTSASLVFSAGDLATPSPKKNRNGEFKGRDEEEQCRLYYYRFSLAQSIDKGKQPERNEITHQFALSPIPFEFPSLCEDSGMTAARYVYGCSVSEDSSFGAALGRAVKIDSIVKFNVEVLISKGRTNPPAKGGCVDNRSVSEILTDTTRKKGDVLDPIQIFKLPPEHYAQESRFVPRANGMSEDDGWLLSYVFDERQLDALGEATPGAQSELWIIDAKEMTSVVAKVELGMRVPYGLHGGWFSAQQVQSQRPFKTMRQRPVLKELDGDERSNLSVWRNVWMRIRDWILGVLS